MLCSGYLLLSITMGGRRLLLDSPARTTYRKVFKVKSVTPERMDVTDVTDVTGRMALPAVRALMGKWAQQARKVKTADPAGPAPLVFPALMAIKDCAEDPAPQARPAQQAQLAQPESLAPLALMEFPARPVKSILSCHLPTPVALRLEQYGSTRM